MNELSLLYNYQIVGAALFALGLVGFLTRRNLIVMFLCAEMMLQGVSVSLISFGRFHADWGGQSLVVFILTVAACEAGIALALILMLAQRAGSLDAVVWQDLREEGLPAYLDQRIPEELLKDQVWPTLTPAGGQPAPNVEDQTHRGTI